MAIHASYGHAFRCGFVAVTLHACIDVGNEQITACRRFVCNVAEQACGIASLLFHKLMRVMIEAHRREVVRCQPDRMNLIARIDLAARMFFDYMAANASSNRELFTNIGGGGLCRTSECGIDTLARGVFPVRDSATDNRFLRHIRVAEFAQILTFQRKHYLERLAMRQLSVRHSWVERQLVTSNAAGFHRYRNKVFPIQREQTGDARMYRCRE